MAILSCQADDRERPAYNPGINVFKTMKFYFFQQRLSTPVSPSKAVINASLWLYASYIITVFMEKINKNVTLLGLIICIFTRTAV